VGRKERRDLERKIKHLQKTKPWQLQALVNEQYNREIYEKRMNNEVLKPGDKVMLDWVKITEDPDWENFKPEYQKFVEENAGKIFTLSKEVKAQGPWAFVSFKEDETDPKWLFYLGYVKKVKDDT
jgi:hypothetical protein